MQDNATLAMKPFVTEMLADLDNRDEADREQIKAIQHRIRERGVVRSHIRRQYVPGTLDEGPLDSSLDGCPMTRDEIREIGTRPRILEEMARRSPGRKIRSMAAARWMRAADLFETNPENVSKGLARHMRRNPTKWHPTDPGEFQLIDTDETPDQKHDGRRHEEQGGPVERNQGTLEPVVDLWNPLS